MAKQRIARTFARRHGWRRAPAYHAARLEATVVKAGPIDRHREMASDVVHVPRNSRAARFSAALANAHTSGGGPIGYASVDRPRLNAESEFSIQGTRYRRYRQRHVG